MSFLLFLDTFPYSRDFVVSPVSRKEARRTLVIISFVAEYPEAEGDNKEEDFHYAILQFVFLSLSDPGKPGVRSLGPDVTNTPL